MKLLYELSVEVLKHYSKKNGRSIHRNKLTGRMFPGKSADLRSAEVYLQDKIINKGISYVQTPYEGRVHAQFTFIFPTEVYFTKEGTISKNLPDISNLYELVQDCLQSTRFIKNDTQIDSHDGSRRKPGSKYILEIKLFEYND